MIHANTGGPDYQLKNSFCDPNSIVALTRGRSDGAQAEDLGVDVEFFAEAGEARAGGGVSEDEEGDGGGGRRVAEVPDDGIGKCTAEVRRVAVGGSMA